MQLQGTVYLDSVFFLNLVMNFYLLLLVAKLSGKTATFQRSLAGSAVGAAIYCLLLVMPGTYTLKVLLGMIPAGMLTVKIACQTKGLKETAYTAGYLFVFSFFLGGFILFLKYQFPGFFQKTSSLVWLPAAGLLGYLVSCLMMKLLSGRKQELFCYVNLKGDKGTHQVRALVDTGNGLKEPLSARPVAILDAPEWKELTGLMKPERYKVIPYHSIGCDHGVLEGYEVEEIEIISRAQRRQLKKVIIAVSQGRVSGKGAYQMILPSEFMG